MSQSVMQIPPPPPAENSTRAVWPSAKKMPFPSVRDATAHLAAPGVAQQAPLARYFFLRRPHFSNGTKSAGLVLFNDPAGSIGSRQSLLLLCVDEYR